MRRLIFLAIFLLAVGLGCRAAAGPTPESAPVQGPQQPAPTCSTEGYDHLPAGDILVAEIEDQELAEFTYENGILYVTSGNQHDSTPLPEGIHYMTFILSEGDTAIARADMEINICGGEFYYRNIIISPYQSQDA